MGQGGGCEAQGRAFQTGRRDVGRAAVQDVTGRGRGRGVQGPAGGWKPCFSLTNSSGHVRTVSVTETSSSVVLILTALHLKFYNLQSALTEYSGFLRKGNFKVITTLHLYRKLNLCYAQLLFGLIWQNTEHFRSSFD